MKALWSHADDVVYHGSDWRASCRLVARCSPTGKAQAAMKLGGEIRYNGGPDCIVGQDIAATYHRAAGTNTDAEGNIGDRHDQGHEHLS